MTAEGGGLPVVGRAALIASVAASEVGRWRGCLLPVRIRPDGSITGIPRDRLPVRSGMDRLIHSKIRLVQIRVTREQAERAGLLGGHAAAMRTELPVQVTQVRLNHQNM